MVDQVWRLLGALCRRLDIQSRARFEPDNLVHQVAALLMLSCCVLLLTQLALGGDESRINYDSADLRADMVRLAFSALSYLGLALLGVGWHTRRPLTESIKRLGLAVPTRRDWLASLALAIALFVLAQAGVAIWAKSVSTVEFEMQSLPARQLFEAYVAVLPAGVFLALASAIGEEILVRGALQPVFGIGVSSLFFVLLHTQYLFAPAALILFLVSLGFGWLRRRQGTSAAIICHAVYNLLPFLIHRLPF